MKLKALALTAIGLANFPGTASATLTDILAADPSRIVRIAGSTSSDGLLNRYLAGEVAPFNDAFVCEGGTQTWINIAKGQPSTSSALNRGGDWGVGCTVKAGVPGLDPGQYYVFLKHGSGGSGSGTSPVALPPSNPASQLSYPVLDTNCTQNALDSSLVSCASAPAQAAPNFGISDLEPRVFFGVNEPETGGAFPPAGGVIPTSIPAFGLTFGFPITTSFYSVLQAAQINKGLLPASCAVGDTTVACRPSLTTPNIKDIVTSGPITGANLRIGGTRLCDAATGVDAVINPPVSFACPSNTVIRVVRRVRGSGTQATGHMYTQVGEAFWGVPPVQPIWTNTQILELNAAGPLGETGVVSGATFEARGSGDVDACLNGLNSNTPTVINSRLDGTGFNAGNPHRVVCQGAGQFAIGVNTFDRLNREGANWRFPKIDDEMPGSDNVWAGKYRFWGTTHVNCRNVGQADPFTTFCTTFGNTVGRQAAVAQLNTGAILAYVALSTVTGNTCSTTFNPAAPTVGWTHTLSGFGGIVDSRRISIPLWDRRTSATPGCFDKRLVP